MIDPIIELKKGNTTFLENGYLTDGDTKYLFRLLEEEPDKKEIIKKNIYQFIKLGYSKYHELFDIIYLDSDLFNYTVYLLTKELTVAFFTLKEIDNMIHKTDWGFDYIIKNLEEFMNREDYVDIIKLLISYSKELDDDKIYFVLLETFLNTNNQNAKARFIFSSLVNNMPINDSDILKSLYISSNDFDYKQESLPFYKEKENVSSTLPYELALYLKKYHKEKQALIKDNFELFFNAESKYKMAFLDNCIDYISDDILEKYHMLFNIYKKHSYKAVDEVMTYLINYNCENILLDIIGDKEVTYLRRGTTTVAYRVQNQVFKISRRKHEMNSERNLFLLAPTKTTYINDENGEVVGIIEQQEYLDKEYNGISITRDDILNFLEELDKQGYEITDPDCLQCCPSNFGFLRDYRDAMLGDYQSYSELPEWFKKRPIVLYDIDLVYKKDAPYKKVFRNYC